jgi:hypothetical protein
MLKMIRGERSVQDVVFSGTNYDDEGDYRFIDEAPIVRGSIENPRLCPASELEAGHRELRSLDCLQYVE